MKNYFSLICKSFSSLLKALEWDRYSIWLYVSTVKESSFLALMQFLKSHTLLRFNNLTELTLIDNPAELNRFKLIILLTSIEYNSKLSLIAPLSNYSAPSISSIYPNSSWSEREARDMFGVHFTNNSDLRRLLTDYGFEGFPLRKDFPLTGYLEVRYDDEFQRIVYEPVELAQEFRVFQLSSPWEKY